MKRPPLPLFTGLSRRHQDGGFSLIEVVLAMGVVGFALVSLLGLLPAGLSLFKQAMTNTVESQIVQSITNDLLLTDFSHLNSNTTLTYQYDNEGRLVTGSTTSNPVIYTVTVTFQSVNDLWSYPVKLQSQSGGSTTDEGLNVRIIITNKTTPADPHSYSFIITNNNI